MTLSWALGGCVGSYIAEVLCGWRGRGAARCVKEIGRGAEVDGSVILRSG